jgi:hypothetical protein
VFISGLIKTLDIQVKNNKKIVAPLLVLPLVLATIMGITILLPFQALNAQNATTPQNATAQIENATATDDQSVDVSVLETLAQPGFGNVLEVEDREGNPVPISYNIVGGRAFAMVGDPARHALFVLVDPGIDGGSLEIGLPRNVLDSKSSDGADSRFVVTMDGEQISGEATGICIGDCPNIWNSFKETETTGTDRVLTVIFGPQNRVIEIVGNQGILF